MKIVIIILSFLIVRILSFNSVIFKFRSLFRISLPSVLNSENKPSQGLYVLKKGSGSNINKDIDNILKDGNKNHPEKIRNLQNLITSRQSELNHVHAVTIMQRCVRNRVDVTDVIPLSEIIKLFNGRNHRLEWSPSEIAQALYGMKSLSSKTPNISEYCREIEIRLMACTTKFSGQEIGNSLYGLQKFSSSSEMIRSLLSSLIPRVDASTVLTGQEISNSLFGLRRMTSDVSEVRNLLVVLARKIDESPHDLNSQGVSNSLNGLQGMSSDIPEVITLVKSLTNKIENCSEMLSPIAIGSSLLGMRCMSSETPEVKRLLTVLIGKLKQSDAKLNPISVSSALNGLRRMSDDDEIVRQLLDVLATKILTSSSLDPGAISSSLYGLRKVSGKFDESKRLFGALVSVINTNDTRLQFTSLDIARTLYGLQSVSCDDCFEILPVLRLVKAQIGRSKEVFTSREIGMSLYGLKSQTAKYSEVQDVVRAIAQHVARYGLKDGLTPQSLSMVMMGLQGMSSTSGNGVLELLHVLTPLAKAQTRVMDAQACGNVLYGLQSMSSNETEVRAFLKVLAVSMEACTEDMSPQELCNAYYGLQNMDSIHGEVIQVLRVLNDKLEKTSLVVGHAFTAQGLGNAVSGFQTMTTDDSAEVGRGLALWGEKISQSKNVMAPHELGNALFGLQGVSKESSEVQSLLGALLVKMRESEGIFSARDIGFALCGLNGLRSKLEEGGSISSNSSPELSDIMKELNFKVALTEFGGEPNLLFLQFGKAIRVKSGMTSAMFNI